VPRVVFTTYRRLAAKAGCLFDMTTDQIINYDGKVPEKIVMEDKTTVRANAPDSAASIR